MAKDKTAAERQRRYRQNRMGAGYTRLQLYVPDSVADHVAAIADRLAQNPSLRFIEIAEATQTATIPLPLKKIVAKKALPLTNEPDKAQSCRTSTNRYQHPQIKSLIWDGMGSQPPWVTLWVEEGKPLSALIQEH
jgi:hypothetical protein